MARINLQGVVSAGSAPAFEPSEQQAAIFQWVKEEAGSAVVEAVAGSGKTTTLIHACKGMRGKVALGAFNKRIADEIAQKLTVNGVGSNVSAKTFHSYGYGAWRAVAPGAKVEGRKLDMLANDYLLLDDSMSAIVKKLVSIAKNHAVGINWRPDDQSAWEHLVEHYNLLADADPTDMKLRTQVMELANKLLGYSIAANHEMIDFDDMLFAPLLEQVPIEQHDWVLVDEAQDTNPTRRLLARRMLKADGRLIAVGDRHQAIYGFTGADADALELIANEFKCKYLPLTITYRCPKKVVAFAQTWVSHIKAADTAREGEVSTISPVEFAKHWSKLGVNDVILCRNTRPIVSLAFDLIRNRVPCHVEGRDIGKGLIALTRRSKKPDAREMYEELAEWSAERISQLLNKKRNFEADALEDKVMTIKVFVDHLPFKATVWDLHKEINKLFGDTEEGGTPQNLTLSTIHKAKGREWHNVYLYGRTKYMPSRYAKQAWELDQENNLIYVAVTRAMHKLIEVDLSKIDEPVTVEVQDVDTKAVA